MLILRLVVFVCFFMLSGCAVLVPENGCLTRGKPGFHETDPQDLTLHVAWPSFDGETPYFSLDKTSNYPGMKIDLVEVEQKDVTRFSCGSNEIRASSLSTDAGVWRSYWADARDDKTWGAGIGFPGLEEEPRIDEFGFAFVNNTTGKVSLSCGCLVN